MHRNPFLLACLFAAFGVGMTSIVGAASSSVTGGACLDWRWIGVQTDAGACPVPAGSGWQTSKLFAIEGGAATPSLKRFCRYEDPTGTAATSAVTALVGSGLSRVDRDCVAVTGQSELATSHWVELDGWLRAQAGATIGALLGSSAVRLAVIDSNPTNAIDPVFDIGTSPHGNALITMAERLLCNATNPCATAVTSQLALEFVRVNPARRDIGDVDAVQGGNLGSIGDLARAIHAEVVAWNAGPASNLVLNLSVAWAPEFGGLEPKLRDMPAGVQAVHAALVDASCRGALAIAAAGNRGGGSDAEAGPMLPAAWETLAAPTYAQCVAALGGGGATAPKAFTGSYRPLVYAVSGIEADGTPLDNMRVGSQARIVAFGDHGVTETALVPIGAPTATLTGSSVATLLASLNAAVAWSWNPAWSAHETIERVHGAAAGTPSALGRAADFCLGATNGSPCAGGASRDVHRVSLCATRIAAGPPVPGASCSWDARAIDLDAVDYAAFDAGAARVDLGTLTVVLVPPECRGAVVHAGVAAVGGSYCPHVTLPGMASRPWVFPQPGSDLCPECTLRNGTNVNSIAATGMRPSADEHALRIELADGFNGSATDITLVVGGDLYRVYAGTPLHAGARLLVVGLDRVRGDLSTAMLAMRVNDQYSSLGPLLRDR